MEEVFRPPVGSISAMTTTSTVRNIPLDRLILSPANVRKSPTSASEDAELKASIRAGGLKQNLIVCPVPGEPERFALTAGRRRLKASQPPAYIRASKKVSNLE
jgi:ParB family chromosome partitioning protein